MNSLYELDPKWKQLLQLDNFLNGLTVHEFVQGLCQSQVKNSKNNNKENTRENDSPQKKKDGSNGVNGMNNNIDSKLDNLDPKPYIRTLESTLKELQKLEKECTQKNNTLKGKVSESEIQHSEKMLEITPQFQNITSKINVLDDGLSKVNYVVSPLATKLEESIRSKNSYIESVLLIKMYQDFYKLSNNKPKKEISNGHQEEDQGVPVFFQQFDPSSIKNYSQGVQIVTVLRNLLLLTHKLETKALPETITTTTSIESFADQLESKLLDNFNFSYRSNDFHKLNGIALILNYYNDGENVIQSFIDNHSYLNEQLALQKNETTNPSNQPIIKISSSLVEKINNPDIHTVFYDDDFVHYLDDLTNIIIKESKLVYIVFETKTTKVIQMFFQTLFQQIIDPKIESLLNQCLKISNLAYCRMLHGLYSSVQNFMKVLQDFYNSDNEGVNSSINSILESYCDEIFLKTIINRSKFINIEKRSLESVLFSKTLKFNSINETKIKSKLLEKNLINNFNNNGSDGVRSSTAANNLNRVEKNNTINGTNNFSNTAQKKFLEFNTFIKSRLDKSEKTYDEGGLNSSTNPSLSSSASATNSAISTGNSDTEFSLTTLDSMLKCFIESLARVMELIPRKSGEYSVELLEILIVSVVGQYIENGLETAYYNLTKSNVEDESFMISVSSSIYYISKSTEMLNLLSISIKTIILPVLNNTPKLKKQVIDLTNASFKKMELMINSILNKLIALCSLKYSISLAKQKKKDYLLRDVDMIDHDTLPVMEISQFLTAFYKNVVNCGLSGDNLTNLLVNAGHELYLQLITHYTKFSVNSIGGIVLTKDIIGYQTTIEKWGLKNAKLMKDFAILRELANIFTVQPELVSSLIKEGNLADFNPQIIGEYILKRDDYMNNGLLNRLKISLR